MTGGSDTVLIQLTFRLWINEFFGKSTSFVPSDVSSLRPMEHGKQRDTGNEVVTEKLFLTNERMELENVSQTVSNWGSLPRHVLKFIFLSFCSFFTTRLCDGWYENSVLLSCKSNSFLHERFCTCFCFESEGFSTRKRPIVQTFRL